jgi:hypothetical protein
VGCSATQNDTPWGVATVRSKAGTVTVAGRLVVPVRRFRLEAGGLLLDIEIDDTNPYRDLSGPTPPRRLGDDDLRHWSDQLTRSWRLLAEHHQRFAPAIAAGLQSVVPLPSAQRFRPLSASGDEAFGCALVSRPDNPTQLAATLVHEFQHNKLGALLHVLPLCGDGADRFYAPWRDDPRPLSGLLQGAYAFTGVTEFWRRQREVDRPAGAGLAHLEFCLWRAQTRRALQDIADHPSLTSLGQEFVAALRNTGDAWREELVPKEFAEAARLAAIDHRARWRGHHLEVADEVAAQLAGAWRDRTSVKTTLPEPRLKPDPAVRWLDSRAVLLRHRIGDPGRFADIVARPATVQDTVAGALEADVALVTGELSNARRLYLRLLAHDPTHVAAWVGLGHTVGDRTHPASIALLARPELVVATARHLDPAAIEPLDLAGWIGTQL